MPDEHNFFVGALEGIEQLRLGDLRPITTRRQPQSEGVLADGCDDVLDEVAEPLRRLFYPLSCAVVRIEEHVTWRIDGCKGGAIDLRMEIQPGRDGVPGEAVNENQRDGCRIIRQKGIGSGVPADVRSTMHGWMRRSSFRQ